MTSRKFSIIAIAIGVIVTQPYLLSGQGMPDEVRRKFNKYVGIWNVEYRIDGEVTTKGRLSMIPFPNGEGFEYRYVGGDWNTGDQANSLGIIGWDPSKQKLIERNFDDLGASFSSTFHFANDGTMSAPMSGVGINGEGEMVPLRGERTISMVNGKIKVESRIKLEGEGEQSITSEFTRISDEDARKQVQRAYKIYDEYFNGVWDLENKSAENVTHGLLRVWTGSSGVAHVVEATYENGEGFVDLWSYDQRHGSWSGRFCNELGHEGFSLLAPLNVDKIGAGFSTTSHGLGFAGGKVSWWETTWNVVSDNEYNLSIVDKLGNTPTTVLTLHRRTPKGTTDGDKVFRSFVDAVMGGHWKTTQNNQVVDHAYDWSIPGKFASLIGTGGDVPFVATIGVDPESGHCTWWFFNEQHGVGKSIMTQVSDNEWLLTQVAGTIKYRGITKLLDHNTIEQEVMEFAAGGKTILSPGSKFIWKRHK